MGNFTSVHDTPKVTHLFGAISFQTSLHELDPRAQLTQVITLTNRDSYSYMGEVGTKREIITNLKLKSLQKT